jgi:two-component sensor histidine kinase
MTPPHLASGLGLYVGEMAHRVANEYTLAIASLSLAAERSASSDAKAALRSAMARLRSYAAVYRTLQPPAVAGETDLSCHLQILCGAMVEASLAERGIGLILVDRAIPLDSLRCWKVGLIVAELVTNAVRHAFRGMGGTITVELLAFGHSVGCRISDDGRGFFNAAPGSGGVIIGALARELGGRVQQECCARGSSILLMFPRSEG